MDLASSINQKVGFAIEHCTRDAKGDAMLHLVIAKLKVGAENMEGNTTAPRHYGAVRVRRTLVTCRNCFQRPNWKAASA